MDARRLGRLGEEFQPLDDVAFIQQMTIVLFQPGPAIVQICLCGYCRHGWQYGSTYEVIAMDKDDEDKQTPKPKRGAPASRRGTRKRGGGKAGADASTIKKSTGAGTSAE